MRAPQSPLLIDERRREIAKIVQQEGRVAVEDLVRRLKVSAVTLRADLGHLAKEGLVVRSYGGAMLPQDNNREFPLRVKKSINHAEKVRIAEIAAKLVKPRQRVILDSGTTSAEVARAIKGTNLEGLTVITHALNIAQELSDAMAISTIMIGGVMRHVAGSFVGPQAEAQLRQLAADHLFLGVDGFHPSMGISTPDLLEAQINSTMIEIAQEVTVVADASKLGRRSLSVIGDLSKVHRLITGEAANKELVEAIRDKGVEVLLA
jgi:DeoR family transcriptional regulator, aga operon transcriptional repressor